MAMPEVNERLLGELESMGFPTNRATRALHYSGNSSLNEAVNWVIEHENDPDIDQIPLVSVNIKIENGDWFSVPEEVKLKAQQLRGHTNGAGKNLEESKKIQPELEKEMSQALSEANLEEEGKRENERERILEMLRTKKEEVRAREKQLRKDEKERRRTNKETMEAKRSLEENQRKRSLAQTDLEKEEEKRARERIRRRVEEDKVERRRKLGFPNENMETVKSTIPNLEKKKEVQKLSINPEQMRDCLRSLKRNHKDENAKVKRAFQTLLKIVGNITKNPNEDKFRRIRLSNPTFQERVGNLKGGIEFLEICGFEKIKDGDNFYLLMPRDKVNILALNLAGIELNSATSNPYFGLFSN